MNGDVSAERVMRCIAFCVRSFHIFPRLRFSTFAWADWTAALLSSTSGHRVERLLASETGPGITSRGRHSRYAKPQKTNGNSPGFEGSLLKFRKTL